MLFFCLYNPSFFFSLFCLYVDCFSIPFYLFSPINYMSLPFFLIVAFGFSLYIIGILMYYIYIKIILCQFTFNVRNLEKHIFLFHPLCYWCIDFTSVSPYRVYYHFFKGFYEIGILKWYLNVASVFIPLNKRNKLRTIFPLICFTLYFLFGEVFVHFFLQSTSGVRKLVL